MKTPRDHRFLHRRSISRIRPLVLPLLVSILSLGLVRAANDAEKGKEPRPREASTNRDRDPSEGDNLKPGAQVSPVEISIEEIPVGEVRLESPDGVNLDFAFRQPRGEGPFPAIVFFHGGGGQSPLGGLKRSLVTGAVQTRFLAKGYMVAQSSRRPYWKSDRGDDGPTGFHDAVGDAVLIVDKVKELPGVDPDRVTLYGGSGGGILALVTASRIDVAAVVAGEPATVIALDPKTGLVASPADYRSLIEDPLPHYTAERREEMHAWMRAIDCPVLLLQGKPVGLHAVNFEILIPEMKDLGKDISSITYPDVTHGFYWGTRKAGATEELIERIVDEVDDFIAQHDGKEDR